MNFNVVKLSYITVERKIHLHNKKRKFSFSSSELPKSFLKADKELKIVFKLGTDLLMTINRILELIKSF